FRVGQQIMEPQASLVRPHDQSIRNFRKSGIWAGEIVFEYHLRAGNDVRIIAKYQETARASKALARQIQRANQRLAVVGHDVLRMIFHQWPCVALYVRASAFEQRSQFLQSSFPTASSMCD